MAEKTKEKIPWSKRVQQIKEQYPSVDRIDWYKLFETDPNVMGKLINDILKAEPESSGRPGKRPAVDKATTKIKIHQMKDEDYSIKPFSDALNILKGDRSYRHLARNTGIDKMILHDLIAGNREPSVDQMEKIAKGLKRHPSYFLEWRIAYIVKTLADRMMEVPETSIVQYTKLRGLSGSS